MHYHIRILSKVSNSASSYEGVLQVFPAAPYSVNAFKEYSAVIAFPVLHRLPASYSTHPHRYLYT